MIIVIVVVVGRWCRNVCGHFFRVFDSIRFELSSDSFRNGKKKGELRKQKKKKELWFAFERWKLGKGCGRAGVSEKRMRCPAMDRSAWLMRTLLTSCSWYHFEGTFMMSPKTESKSMWLIENGQSFSIRKETAICDGECCKDSDELFEMIHILTDSVCVCLLKRTNKRWKRHITNTSGDEGGRTKVISGSAVRTWHERMMTNRKWLKQKQISRGSRRRRNERLSSANNEK